MTRASASEQGRLALHDLAAEEAARWDTLNAAYRQRFGFPFILCIARHSRDSALAVHVARASLGQCDAGRLEVIEGATHWVQHEEPARVLDLTLAHLRAG